MASPPILPTSAKRVASARKYRQKPSPGPALAEPLREVDLEFALHGGEDYELLFTAPRGKRIPSRIAGVPITHIGHITRGRKIFLTNRSGAARELKPRGWEHFRK